MVGVLLTIGNIALSQRLREKHGEVAIYLF